MDENLEQKQEHQVSQADQQDDWRQQLESRISELEKRSEEWRNAALSAYNTVAGLYSHLSQLAASTEAAQPPQTPRPESSPPGTVWSEFDPFDEEQRRYLASVISSYNQDRQVIRSLQEELQNFKAALGALNQGVIPSGLAVVVGMVRDMLRLHSQDPEAVLDDKNFEKLARVMAEQNVYSFSKAYEQAFGEKLKQRELEKLRKQVEEELKAQMLSGAVRTTENGPSRYSVAKEVPAQVAELARRLAAMSQ